MYIFNFLKSLNDLLNVQVPEVPRINPNDDAIYMGYKPFSELDEKIRENMKDHLEVAVAMVYITLPELQMSACDVTQALAYTKKLDSEPIDDKFHQLPIDLAEAIIYEAVWLFDQLTDLPSDKTFLKLCEGGVPQLNALYHDNSDADNLPVLITFESLIAKDMFFSQAKYFIKKYVNARLADIENSYEGNILSIDIDAILAKQIEKYLSNQPYSTWSTKTLTNVDNPEFDMFIQQISPFTAGR